MKATRVRILIFGALAASWMLANPYEASAGITVGGPLTVIVDDSPINTDFSQTLPVGAGTTSLDQGEMTVSQMLVSTGPGTQWLVLDFEATNGLPLAGNPGGFWSMGADLPLSSPGGFTGVFGYWSVNGAPSSPINPIPVSGFVSNVETDPLNPSISPVYGEEFGGAIVSGTTSLALTDLVYFDPYSYYIGLGGMNPSAINGFVIGMQVTDASVPEPSSLALALAGLASGGLFSFVRYRRNRA
jgi:hypothetical protein